MRLFFIGLGAGIVVSITMCVWIASLANSSSNELEFGKQLTTDFAPHTDSVPETLRGLATFTNSVQLRKSLHLFLVDQDKEQLLDFIDESTQLSSHQDLIQDTLFQHLSLYDPQAALNKVWDLDKRRWHKLLVIIFDTWSYTSLAGALRTAFTLDEDLQRYALQTIVLNRLDDLAESELVQITQSLGEHKINVLSSQVKTLQMLGQPRDAWDLLLNDSVQDYDQFSLFVDVASAWISQEGSIGFDGIFPTMQSIDETDRRQIKQKIVGQIVVVNPQAAWESMLRLQLDVDSWNYWKVMFEWGSIDPQQAFEHLKEIHSEEIKHAAYRGLIAGWAHESPTAVLDNRQVFPPDYRTTALELGVRSLAYNQSFEPAVQYIQDAASQGENVDEAARTLATIWARQDPLTAIDWLTTNVSIDNWVNGIALQSVIGSLTLADPESAKQFVLTHEFPSVRSVDLQGAVVRALATRARFEEARRVISGFEQPVDLSICWILARNLIEFDRADEAIELAHQLPKSQREQYFTGLWRNWISIDPLELVDSIEEFPSQQIQSRVARGILFSHTLGPSFLEPQQIEYLHSLVILNEEHQGNSQNATP